MQNEYIEPFAWYIVKYTGGSEWAVYTPKLSLWLRKGDGTRTLEDRA